MNLRLRRGPAHHQPSLGIGRYAGLARQRDKDGRTCALRRSRSGSGRGVVIQPLFRLESVCILPPQDGPANDPDLQWRDHGRGDRRAELQAPGRKRSSPATKRRHSNRFAGRRRLAHRVGTRCGLRTLRPVARDGGRPCQPRRDGVYPVGGWWKEKPFPERFDTLARYSLIVTMRAPGSDVDIYTPAQIAIAAEVLAVRRLGQHLRSKSRLPHFTFASPTRNSIVAGAPSFPQLVHSVRSSRSRTRRTPP